MQACSPSQHLCSSQFRRPGDCTLHTRNPALHPPPQHSTQNTSISHCGGMCHASQCSTWTVAMFRSGTSMYTACVGPHTEGSTESQAAQLQEQQLPMQCSHLCCTQQVSWSTRYQNTASLPSLITVGLFHKLAAGGWRHAACSKGTRHERLRSQAMP
jgi:hypothetical protein